MTPLVQLAYQYAVHAHGDQTYGDTPYRHHLAVVAAIMARYGFDDDDNLAAAYLHDVAEDTKYGIADIHAAFNGQVAQLVNAVTGEGTNRRERQENILQKLRAYPAACPLKCADRIANVEAGGKVDMYRREQSAFAEVVKPHVPEAMWERLEKGLNND